MLLMKKNLFVLAACLSAFPAVGLARGLPTPPEAVTFYAREARVSVSEVLRSEATSATDGENAVRITLPAGAVKKSLSIEIDGKPVDDYRWERKPDRAVRAAPINPALARLPEAEQDPERKKLLGEYLALEERAARQQGEKRAFESRLAFWNSFSGGQDKAADAEQGKRGQTLSVEAAKIDAQLGERIPDLQLGLQKCETALAETNRLLAEALRALREYDDARDGDTAIVPVRKTGEVKARYSYLLPVSCVVRYRLNAHPEKDVLDVASLVDLTQRSGIDWNGAEIFLALTDRSPRPYPPVPDPWIVDFEDSTRKQPLAATKGDISSEAQQRLVTAAGPTPSQLPSQTEMATYRLWKLGRRDIKHNSPATAQLAADSFKAGYYYTLRPRSGRRGYLTAVLSFETSVEMAAGQADCFVDDDFVGTQPFQINGSKAVVSLGADPMVTAVVRDLVNTRGEQGFMTKSQTRMQHWNITVTNGRSRPVEVRVEEPAPVSRDTSILIKSVATPAPESAEPDEQYAHPALRWVVWKKRLSAGENFVIDWQVTIEAPAGKTLSPGR
jgi:hypothetical protein